MPAELRPRPTQLPLLLTIFAALAWPAAAQTPAPRRDLSPHVTAIRSLIEKNLVAYDRAGVSVALVDDQGNAWVGTFGLADRRKRAPVTEKTVFEMGSISKLFTCVAVMQLQEQGKVDLDRPYRDYVPEFQVPSRFEVGAEAITVRMLMTHHSGLVTDDDPWETTRPERYLYRALLEHLKTTPLLLPPGQRFHYSSFGVHLLGLLVERVSGQDFATYMRRHVLAPLQMPHASFDYRDLPAKTVATAYNYHPAWDKIPKDEIRPAGSLRAPPAEVAHLISMMLSGGEYRGKQILKPESVAEMLRIQGDTHLYDCEMLMGLGFRAARSPLKSGGTLDHYYHNGMARHRSLLLFVPAWKVGMVVATNDYNAAKLFVEGVREAASRAECAAQGEELDWQRPLPRQVERSPEQLQSLTGSYSTLFGIRTLAVSEGVMQMTGRGPGWKLLPLEDGSFQLLRADGKPETFYFNEAPVVLRFGAQPGAEGCVAQIRSGELIVNLWRKLEPPSLPPGWEGYAGTYRPVDAATQQRTSIAEVRLRVEGDRMVVGAVVTPANADSFDPKEGGLASFALRPLGDDRAEVLDGVFSGFDGYTLVFGRDDQGPTLGLEDRRGVALYRRQSSDQKSF